MPPLLRTPSGTPLPDLYRKLSEPTFNLIYGNVKVVLFDYLCREQIPVNFKQIDAYVHQQKGSSARY
jgi:hypothetical protein